MKTDVAPSGVPVAFTTDNPRYLATAGAGGTPSASNLFENQYDTSNGSTYTATTISFVSGTKTIADSGNGFLDANFLQSQQIIVTGSASNNGTYTIVSVAAGAIVVAETLINESAGATVIMAVVRANKLVRFDSSGFLPGSSSAQFGSGADGAVTFDGSTTILGMVPSANVYTMTRDIHCTNITINTGVTVRKAGYRMYSTGTLGGSGTISNNG